MIKINQLKLPVDHSEEDLTTKIKRELKLGKNDIFIYKVLKRSLDARKKPELFYVYSIQVELVDEDRVLKRVKSNSIGKMKEIKYRLPACGEETTKHRPVIIGAGPAGLFAAYSLVKTGFRPILLERGKAVEARTRDVEGFWKTGVLDPASNVQFGEGGAGTFSDGKLNTAVKDPSGRNQFVLETFVKFGAQSEILYDNKPHIGTDVLSEVIVNMRKFLIDKGCEIFFETRAKDFVIEDGQIRRVICEDKSFDTEVVILAPGHSARDTFLRLEELGIPMEAKNFAVGFRVEHPQDMMNEAMYGIQKKLVLPAAPYKVTSNFPNGRGVYSFCMCPGGYVVNSSSEDLGTVVNGMSYAGRQGKNANSAIIVSVTEKDFGAGDALAGMRFQERLERENYKLAMGKIPQQLYGDYCQNVASTAYGDFDSQTRGMTQFANLRGLMSEDMEESFMQGMAHFSRIIKGFDRKDAILSGMETRTSSPIRIVRNQDMESTVRGLYPCGEGAGYAGGITSAAMDGIKVAEAVILKYKPVG